MFATLSPRLRRAVKPHLAVLLLLAVLWQAVAVQSHVHPGNDPALVKVNVTAPGHDGDSAPCYLCEAQALLSVAVTPDPIGVAAPLAIIAFYAPDRLRPALCVPLLSRPCSRAPPAAAIL